MSIHRCVKQNAIAIIFMHSCTFISKPAKRRAIICTRRITLNIHEICLIVIIL